MKRFLILLIVILIYNCSTNTFRVNRGKKVILCRDNTDNMRPFNIFPAPWGFFPDGIFSIFALGIRGARHKEHHIYTTMYCE